MINLLLFLIFLFLFSSAKGNQDALYTQIPKASTWGEEYIVVPNPGLKNQEYFVEVVSIVNDLTVLFFNGGGRHTFR